MPTDHACSAAAEQAARCLAPVRSALMPDGRTESSSAAEVMPVVLRNYLGANARPPAERATGGARPARVGVATGATALQSCLDGLCAEMNGTLAAWHADLGRHLHAMLTDPRASERQADAWQPVAELQLRAQEALMLVADRGRSGAAGPRLLVARFALLEDVLAGALRRIAVPAETAAACASGLAVAAGSLFGLALGQQEDAADHYF
ncbi:hypothetical protein [Streptomyces sp. TRM68416]|uniref:hypothetical protein n=1 Tax=Streptomyces sp. TRM68416 TaxID=2758412 RepID=UPI001661E175|nr:hypothetical protein [Streptomyces sp. TRM68416]MBD0839494.1 hypothetical protein [Streptomyces sp. TRM68416]